MKYILISIKDRAVNAFEQVGCVRAEGEALRVFHDLIANEKSRYYNHPDDYDLYVVGYFDDQTGDTIGKDWHQHTENTEVATLPKKIADGKSVKEMQKQI